MSFREELNKLEKKINEDFTRLSNLGSYEIFDEVVKDYYDTVADEIFAMKKNDGIVEAINNYDIVDCLDEVYYSDKRGCERLGYLLGVDKDLGLHILSNDTNNVIYIQFYDVSSTLEKISIIEVMEESRKTELQKEFERDTPSIQGITGNEYNITYCAYLENLVEKLRSE